MSTKSHRRVRALQRLFTVAFIVQDAGEDVSLMEIQDRVNVLQSETWCERTIRRDVGLLIDTGCVEVSCKSPLLLTWLGFDKLINGACE